MTFGTGRIAVVSLEDLAARAASLVMDLAHGSAVPVKHARDFPRLVAAFDRDRVEGVWRDLIPARPDLLIVPEYSHDVDSVCLRCEDIGRFRRASARTIVSNYALLANRNAFSLPPRT
jgi:hypothetical protein